VLRPDLVHVHSVFNLSFDLPAEARARGIPLVATLHDYTLVCPSGGQRVHRAEAHVCHEIDTARCARCFTESPFHLQMTAGRVAASAGPAAGLVPRAAGALHRRLPMVAAGLARVARGAASRPVTTGDIETRLAAARTVLAAFDRVVAPSASLAGEFVRLGADPERLRVSDNGTRSMTVRPHDAGSGRLRIGYAGTLVWHKGVHVLVEALRELPPSSCELQIFGDPAVSRDYVRDLTARARGLPIRFMGPFGRDRVADVFAGLDVLAVPSMWLENSPLVIHEAFMAGVPVVGSRIGGIADLVRHGRNGLLVDPGSPRALASAVRRLIDEPGLVATLASGVPVVKSMAEDAREWEGEYRRLVDERRETAGPGSRRPAAATA
jgi:glycosyltransferase involved in cell wall biosynthesis